MTVLQDTGQQSQSDDVDTELIDVLIAISVISKRLAEKMNYQTENDKE